MQTGVQLSDKIHQLYAQIAPSIGKKELIVMPDQSFLGRAAAQAILETGERLAREMASASSIPPAKIQELHANVRQVIGMAKDLILDAPSPKEAQEQLQQLSSLSCLLSRLEWGPAERFPVVEFHKAMAPLTRSSELVSPTGRYLIQIDNGKSFLTIFDEKGALPAQVITKEGLYIKEEDVTVRLQKGGAVLIESGLTSATEIERLINSNLQLPELGKKSPLKNVAVKQGFKTSVLGIAFDRKTGEICGVFAVTRGSHPPAKKIEDGEVTLYFVQDVLGAMHFAESASVELCRYGNPDIKLTPEQAASFFSSGAQKVVAETILRMQPKKAFGTLEEEKGYLRLFQHAANLSRIKYYLQKELSQIKAPFIQVVFDHEGIVIGAHTAESMKKSGAEEQDRVTITLVRNKKNDWEQSMDESFGFFSMEQLKLMDRTLEELLEELNFKPEKTQ